MDTVHAPPSRSGSKNIAVLRQLDRPFVLRCMAYPRGERYVAECIDLDIIVRAETADGAIGNLRQAMEGYFATVLNEAGSKELGTTGRVTGLIPRSAPMSHRLRYHLYCLRAAWSGPNRNFRIFDWPSNANCPSAI